jgi:type IV pilus assembly protein PilB
MRILDKQKSTLPLPALGFSEDNLAKYRECIRQPYGMILHCGPTGSGKSMTLYSALNEINTPDVSSAPPRTRSNTRSPA